MCIDNVIQQHSDEKSDLHERIGRDDFILPFSPDHRKADDGKKGKRAQEQFCRKPDFHGCQQAPQAEDCCRDPEVLEIGQGVFCVQLRFFEPHPGDVSQNHCPKGGADDPGEEEIADGCDREREEQYHAQHLIGPVPKFLFHGRSFPGLCLFFCLYSISFPVGFKVFF